MYVANRRIDAITVEKTEKFQLENHRYQFIVKTGLTKPCDKNKICKRI